MASGRLLIADDDIHICELIKDIAESVGYTVCITNTLTNFSSQYKPFQPTVITLDLNLTKNDGVEFIKFLSEQKCSAPIIIISGCDERIRASSQRLGQEYGLTIHQHLAKPFDIGELKKILSDINHDEVLITADRLAKAIEDYELTLHFQPKIDSKTQKMTGVEALVRWQPRNNGMVFPDAFIPLAEQTGLIQPLSFWVIEQAFKLKKEWEEKNLNFSIAINLSSKLLNDLLLPEKLVKMAEDRQVNPESICFEVTETAMYTEPATAMNILTRLGIKGFKISIDDFGTGFSSLVQLNKMPFNEIKIDKSFILNSLKDPDALIIAKSIVDLGHNLRLSVVAEGVENKTIQDKIQNLNCDTLQGYYISKPISINDFNHWIKDNLDENLTLIKKND